MKIYILRLAAVSDILKPILQSYIYIEAVPPDLMQFVSVFNSRTHLLNSIQTSNMVSFLLKKTFIFFSVMKKFLSVTCSSLTTNRVM